jgi:hypothetical protein
MDDSLIHTREMILQQSPENEADELRRKWLEQPLLRTRPRVAIKGEDMHAISTGFLESRVEAELSTLREQRRKAAEVEVERQKSAVTTANSTLRLALGEDFIRNAGICVRDGKAEFMFRDKPYTLINDKERGYLLNDEKLVDAAGTVADKLIATLVRMEDF